MERTGEILGGTPTGTSSSSTGASTPEGCVTVEETTICPHCGREIAGEWVPFPPALQKKYGQEGQVWFPPCTPECEAKNDLRKWELDRRNARVRELLGRSEIPERLSRASFDHFEQHFSQAARCGLDAVAGYVRDWEANREAGKGLYICGPVGTGKTHLACAAALELIRREGVPTLFRTAPTLLDKMRPSSGPDERQSWMDAATGAELLVLDDLGAERPSEWQEERIFVLVNERNRKALPTVFTSNVGPGDLEARVGERTRSRIIEMCDFVVMDGPDYRVESRRKT